MHQRYPPQLDGSWTQGTKRLKSSSPSRSAPASVSLDITGLLLTSPIKSVSKESTNQVRKESMAEKRGGAVNEGVSDW